ncbi:hypothetical protein [Acidovorax cavernicola]|uniref:Uncharacterized protein n=1 Tax=Acidovorax cavernicola TaxID=1675792 RepID=A0A9X8CZX2_9BURK|nr:hypothetical protein [Acidovorax cavernicola]RIX74438.1 hypothetical protein D3H34_27285 [Acidovorax cavernicola]
MFVLFVGGLAHGETHHVDDKLTAVDMDDPIRLKAGRQRYEIRRWQWVDAAHGYDAVAVNSFVLPSELEAKVRDALDEARKRA